MQRYKNSFNLQSIFIHILIGITILHIKLTYIKSNKLQLTVKILSLQKRKKALCQARYIQYIHLEYVTNQILLSYETY